MIVTTTPSVDGYRISGYYGVVFGEVITGVNFLRDFGAGIRNIVGGRSEGYEQELTQARTEALQELEQRAAQVRDRVSVRPARCDRVAHDLAAVLQHPVGRLDRAAALHPARTARRWRPMLATQPSARGVR